MKDRRGPLIDRPIFGLVVVLLIAVSLVGLDYAIDKGWLSDPGLPAWVQAIGVIAALAIAIYIPQSVHRREIKERTKDRRRRARSLALALYPELLEMKKKLNRTNVDAMLSLHETIEIPPVLIESVDRLYLLGSAGDEIQQFLAIVRQLYRMIAEARGKPGRQKDIYAYLDSSNTALDRAIELIAAIQDTPV